MRKLVTHFSLRLGLELSGDENCIEFHPILSDCKVRNPQNLAGSVPNVPTSANILIQKKEQKFLLLKFVIPAGFEPTTHSLEGCCSIQLSYGTILCAIFSKCCAKVIHFFQIRYILSTNFRIKSNNRRLGRWLRFHTRTLSICSGRSLSSSLTP